MFRFVWSLVPMALALPAEGIPAPQPDPARSLAGLVEDASGGALPGARVEVVCDEVRRTLMTDQAGRFETTGLPPARCEVTAVLPLFDPVTVTVDLTARRDAYLRLVLSVAGLAAEVVVTPARGEREPLFHVPEAVSIATREELESRPHHILPQALREEPGVLVQQTTAAQGSPFIRGFSAQRIVYLVDGVRFNTSTYRAGATQYLGWIDPAIVERLEIVRGPASVQYGSDALGGTINVISIVPAPGAEIVRPSAELTAGTADLSAGVQAELIVGGPARSWRAGGGVRRVGDLRAGGGRDSRSALTRFLGLPSTTLYRRLPDTGYTQASAHAGTGVALGGGASLSGLYLHTEQHGVSRYDRIIGGDGLHRSVFEPQRLDFGYLRYQRPSAGPFDAVSAAFSVNRQQDDRLEQARPGAVMEQEANRVTAIGYQAQATWTTARHALVFGGEIYDEYIGGRRATVHPGSGSAVEQRPEIPDGSRYVSAGLFAQDTVDAIPGRLALRGGLRYAWFRFRVPADPALAVEASRVAVGAATFHSGLVLAVAPGLNATFTASRGFRAPNAFDLGAIGISGGGFELAPETAASLGAEIGTSDGDDAVSTGRPVRGLGPESAYTFEAGLKWRRDGASASLTLFDLELVDVIQRRTAIFGRSVVGTTVAGHTVVRQDAAGRAYVAADPRPLVTRVNVDRARVVGVEAEGQVRLRPAWLAGAYGSVARGTESGTGVPLRRMPPPMGGVRLRWEPPEREVWAEAGVVFALAQTRLSPGDLGDARIGARRSRAAIAAFFNGPAVDLGLVRDGILLPTGETLAEVQARVLGGQASAPLYTRTAGFVVLNLRGGWQLARRTGVTVLVENLLDRNYRWHGSGVDAPGFNVQVRLRHRF
ncbi:MAG TPA: TonB-dependent receptor [Vicinamibacterales bacterium]|nr:TonB-dependent receptor [Vicinamibacterales bacterium]